MKHSIIVISLAVLLSACGAHKTAETKPKQEISATVATLTEAQKANAGILAGKMEQRQVTGILRVNGKIDVPPQNIVSVSVPMGGYLKSSHLLPGMHVRQGEVLAIIEDQQYIQLQQDYLTAKVKAAFLEKEYNRQKDLNINKASSDKVYQQADADYKSQKVLIKALSERLKLVGIDPERLTENNISRTINIRSTINGYVSKVNANIGKYASPTDVLFELINPTDIHLALKVFEKDLGKLYVGQKVIAYTNNQPDKKYNCEILLVAKDLTAERTADVHCHFEDYDKNLLPGMYMNADISVANNNAWALPDAAIVSFDSKQYAFVQLNDYQYEMVEIKTGNTENGYTEIMEAEKLTNKTFVTRNAYALLMMLKNRSEE